MGAEIKAIQMAMSEKFAMIIKAFGMMISGFLLAFILSWSFALVATAASWAFYMGIWAFGKYTKNAVMKSIAAFNKAGTFAQ